MTWQSWLAYGSMALLMLVGVLLMIIILLQRGRGGGLAGAFGGAGGQSAFGTRAGDVFTKITAVLAILWVFLAGVSRFALEPHATAYASSLPSATELEDQDGTSVEPVGEGEQGEGAQGEGEAGGAGAAGDTNPGGTSNTEDEKTPADPETP